MTPLVHRDAHESRVDLAADRVAYLVVAYGVLLVVAYRSLVLGQSSWDLLAVVVASGVAGLVYRAREGALSGRWVAALVTTIVVAAFVAAAIAVATR
jgi:hypothetical protein